MLIATRSVTARASLDPPVAFEEFYRLHADRVHRALALTLGDHHLAREATDEAMARAYLHWPRVSNYDNPGGWVYRVGLNWATSWRRRFGSEHPVADPPQPVNVSDPGGHLALDLLATLPIKLRSVIVCRLLLQLSTVETASVLDIAEGTVKSRLARGIEALRTIYLRTEEKQ